MQFEIMDELSKSGLYGVTEKPDDHYEYYDESEKQEGPFAFLIGNIGRVEYGKKIKEWENLYGEDIAGVFYDSDFVMNFIVNFPDIETQMKYVTNTTNCAYEREYDPEYAIVTRRSVPSKKAKPENFWCEPEWAHKPISGLRSEISGPQRYHSVILVSTLKCLKEHGLSQTIDAGVTDGEIIIDPNKVFNNFLFQFKPLDELHELVDYLSKGGQTREELLEELKNSALKRAKAQGFANLNSELYKKDISKKFKETIPASSNNVSFNESFSEDIELKSSSIFDDEILDKAKSR